MIQLTDEQQGLVDLVASPSAPRLVLFTGGPGTGKSTALSELTRRLRQLGMTFALAAPSGKAAQRITEATGLPAQTLHRLLHMRPGKDEVRAELTVDVLVVDEASMIGSKLMGAIERATKNVRTVLLVGDADQLPPVSAGQPFHDYLAAGWIPTVRLTQVHRQAAESGIVRAAYAVKEGRVPEWSDDLRFVEVRKAADVPNAVWGILTSAPGCSPDHSQVLAPQKPGPAGVTAINACLELSRDDEDEVMVTRDERIFRRGTKVIHTKNNYKLGDDGIFNGELGYVTSVWPGCTAKGRPSPAKDVVDVEISGQLVTYKGALIKQIAPAWALTIHKSQGSEWRDVVVVVHHSHHFMLSRALLYVALTRASQRVWVVGSKKGLRRAVRNVEDMGRKTNLAGMLAREGRRRSG